MIALLTDFGTEDWFVGAMKGVILSVHPAASIVDITHAIPAGDIRAAAFNLMAAQTSFPEKTIFVAVVDPGVGGPREALLVEAEGRYYLAPDNKLLSFALAGKKRRIRVLENPALRLPEISRTFHGRDVFSPAAAHLSLGVPPASFGPIRKSLLEWPWPKPRHDGKKIAGEIMHIDHFGNAITNIPAAMLGQFPGKWSVKAGGKRVPVKDFYAQAPAGQALALIGSCGLLEVSVNGGHAAKKLGLRIGTPVGMVC